MKPKHKLITGITYKQKTLIENALSSAIMLHDTYCMHDDWNVDMDCDFVKFVKKTSRELTRAAVLFKQKTCNIKKFKRKRKKKHLVLELLNNPDYIIPNEKR